MTSGITLTDFLLARIAEDAALARDPNADGSPHALVCDVNSYSAGDCDCTWPGQVLADCEAKRRIVESYVAEFGQGDWLVDHHTLHLLALPYAGHSNYHEEWK